MNDVGDDNDDDDSCDDVAYMMITMMTDNSWKYSFFTCKVDGGYSPWSEFGPCSKSCGTGGLQKRYRTCSNPAPMNGGKPCFGHPYQTRVCSVIPCPGNKSNIKWALSEFQKLSSSKPG